MWRAHSTDFFRIKEGKIILLLHVFVKKNQATPKKELDLAKKRLSEIKNHDI